MAHWKRVVIDSRHKTAESTSNADFAIQLPYNVQVPRGTKAYVDGAMVSVSWGAVLTGRNDKLYLQETLIATHNNRSPGVYNHSVTLPPGEYNTSTLEAQLEASLNLGTYLPGTYDVNLVGNSYQITNSSNSTTQGTARIFSNSPADLLEMRQLSLNLIGDALNETIGHLTTAFPLHSASQPLRGTYVDLLPFKEVYIHAPTMGGESNMMLPNGNSDCIKRMVITGSSGSVVHDVLNHSLAPITFGTETTLSQLRFQIKDSRNRLLPMAGHEISFELLFVRPDDE